MSSIDHSPIQRHLSIVDIQQSHEQIVGETRWERFEFGRTPVAGAIAHWGTEVNNGDLVHALSTRGVSTLQDDLDKTGFDRRSIYPSQTSLPETAYIEHRIGQQLIREACEARGIKPEDLSLLYICNTVPGTLQEPYDTYGEDIAEAAHATHATVMNVSLACNGFVESMRRIGLMQHQLTDAFVGVVSVEGLTKTIGNWKIGNAENKLLDPSNVGTFTNGGAAVIWQAGRDFHITPGPDMVVAPDNDGVLRAPTAFTYYPTGDDGLMVTESCIRQQIPQPLDGGLHSYMDPKTTAYWGATGAPPILAGFINALQPVPAADGRIWLLSHYPSEGMLAGIIKRLKRFGIDPESIDAPRLVRDGNCSSAVFPQVLLRAGRAGLLRPEEESLAFGFGVGANFSALKISKIKS